MQAPVLAGPSLSLSVLAVRWAQAPAPTTLRLVLAGKTAIRKLTLLALSGTGVLEMVHRRHRTRSQAAAAPRRTQEGAPPWPLRTNASSCSPARHLQTCNAARASLPRPNQTSRDSAGPKPSQSARAHPHTATTPTRTPGGGRTWRMTMPYSRIWKACLAAASTVGFTTGTAEEPRSISSRRTCTRPLAPKCARRAWPTCTARSAAHSFALIACCCRLARYSAARPSRSACTCARPAARRSCALPTSAIRA
mmetsp:Transcript_9089/g.19708  ORF Transcript_9089/g.19708 Transcript_9089/m.19708 type:complete len:251 (-) Transcript_9089:47-799(-)